MWDKGQIDALIIKTNEHLFTYPHHQSALYFGAKALITKKENIAEAERRVNLLMEIEPSLKDSIQVLLNDINDIKSS